jgi:hypothetical protein
MKKELNLFLVEGHDARGVRRKRRPSEAYELQLIE